MMKHTNIYVQCLVYDVIDAAQKTNSDSVSFFSISTILSWARLPLKAT